MDTLMPRGQGRTGAARTKPESDEAVYGNQTENSQIGSYVYCLKTKRNLYYFSLRDIIEYRLFNLIKFRIDTQYGPGALLDSRIRILQTMPGQRADDHALLCYFAAGDVA